MTEHPLIVSVEAGAEPVDSNPRFALWQKIVGKGLPVWGFTLWVQDRWAAFDREHSLKPGLPGHGRTIVGAQHDHAGRPMHCPIVQQAFDAWLPQHPGDPLGLLGYDGGPLPPEAA